MVNSEGKYHGWEIRVAITEIKLLTDMNAGFEAWCNSLRVLAEVEAKGYLTFTLC